MIVAEAQIAGHVAADLPCVRCGYNLRGLAWGAKCTECGTYVAQSKAPPGFRVGSALAARHIRRGLGLLAVSILVQVSADIMLTLTMRFWLQIPSDWIRLAGVRIPPWASFSARLLEFTAIVYILCLFGRSRVRFRRALRLSALVLATLGLVVNTVDFVVGRVWGFSPIPAVIAMIIAGHVCLLGRPVSLVLVGIHLLTLIKVRMLGHLRWLTRLAIVATVAALAGNVGVATSRIADQFLWRTWRMAGINIYLPDIPRIEMFWEISRVAGWWQKHVGAACLIIMLIAVWAYLRALDSTMACNSEHDVRKRRPLFDGSTNP